MDGLLIINKPKGYTSHDVVNVIRKTLNIKKVGHTGTLDPNATGVLPVLIGKATKVSQYLIEHDKKYIATIKLGEKTDTGDAIGNIIENDVNRFNGTEEQIQETLETFLGVQEQTPPMYSAIKINGKKLYEYARQGQKVEVPSRQIEIYSIRLISTNLKELEITFEVSCSKGTYIRVLCEDIAKKLGTIGYMKDLIRTKVDKLDIEKSIKLEELNLENASEKIISIEEVFSEKEKIELDDKKLELFLNGVNLTFELPEELYRIYNKKKFIGLGIIKNNLLKRDMII